MKPRIFGPIFGDRGAIAPFAALMLLPLIGTAALATDVGLWYAQRRHLQTATDMAALSAAQNPTNASAVAGDLLQRNGFDASALASTTLGTYCPDFENIKVPAERFRPGLVACPDGRTPPAPNAVMVSAQTTVPGVLSRAVVGGDDGGGHIGGTPGSEEDPNLHKVSVQATAARIDEAGFQAGTGLVAVDTQKSALLNAVLGNVLGTRINLTAVQYEGLLNADIDALTFLDALAVNVDVSAGTYDGLLDATVGIGDLLEAAIQALRKAGTVAGVAIDGLVSLQGQIVGNPDLTVGDLVDLGVWKNLPIGESTAPTALTADLNVFQLVTMAIQVANKHNAIYIPALNVGLPGIASLQVTATVIEPPKSPPFAFGPEGMTVHTAQVRLQLKLQLLDLFGLLGQGIQLPLYVEAGYGDATLKDISCGLEPAKDATVAVSAKSGVAKAFIGVLPPDLMTNFSRELTVEDFQPAALVDVSLLGLIGIVRVSGRAGITVGSGSSRDLVFDRDDIDNHVAQSVASTGMLDNLLAELGGNDPVTKEPRLKLSACIISLGGLCLIPVKLDTVGNTVGALHTLLDPVIKTVLDPLVDNLLAALGIRLGVMDVVVTGVRCGVPVLIR
ncbi:hypothetical protein FFK22_030370 [Mycobacterium sp. KBS0706]|uniref:pilus assembly protein TadG-related protein n=1 Tax=Mycobacterium sp. KBS0706 TaxID=2578109 RepID=UPI00110FA58B|nr:pilus assembly protein TadG-related protein [Mycobacterium sp. KBS0706]TSD84896.1 hypothetical protein FFK22_030370 [Mycobacterium sp. KBS0706]